MVGLGQAVEVGGVDLGAIAAGAAREAPIHVKNDLAHCLAFKCPGCGAFMPVDQWRISGTLIYVDASTARCSAMCPISRPNLGNPYTETERREQGLSYNDDKGIFHEAKDRRGVNRPWSTQGVPSRTVRFSVASDPGPLADPAYRASAPVLAAQERQREIDAALVIERRIALEAALAVA